MTLSKERIQELKDILEKKARKEISWEEAEEAARNLAGLAEVMYDCWVEEKRRERKLRESPKGFVLEGVGYTCAICHGSTREVGNWFDKWGIKCTTCQKAIDRKEIPPSLAKFRESWYSKWDLESRFNLNHHVLKKWVANGIIKARTILNENGRVHTQLFLLRDNKDFLPPKKMVESKLVSHEKDGQTWHRSEPWYRFVDPFEYLKGYKIMEHMQRTPIEKE